MEECDIITTKMINSGKDKNCKNGWTEVVEKNTKHFEWGSYLSTPPGAWYLLHPYLYEKDRDKEKVKEEVE